MTVATTLSHTGCQRCRRCGNIFRFLLFFRGDRRYSGSYDVDVTPDGEGVVLEVFWLVQFFPADPITVAPLLISVVEIAPAMGAEAPPRVPELIQYAELEPSQDGFAIGPVVDTVKKDADVIRELGFASVVSVL